MDKTANIIEVFSSIQGEGLYIGHRQIFIRFADCNLNCDYCDTPFLKKEYAKIEQTAGKGDFSKIQNPISSTQLAKIIQNLSVTNTHSISLTGGEPLLHSEFLSDFLPKINAKIYLETNGSLPQELKKTVALYDIISMDIKLNSSCGFSINTDTQEEFIKISKDNNKDIFLKVVITKKITDEEIKYLAYLSSKYKVEIILQPITTSNIDLILLSEELQDVQIKLSQLGGISRIIPQTHVYLGLV